jgi:hypothetical protein
MVLPAGRWRNIALVDATLPQQLLDAGGALGLQIQQ